MDDFSILTRDNKNVLPELRGSLLLMRNKPSLNRKIISTPLHLFDSNKIFVRILPIVMVATLFLLIGLF